MKWMIRLIPLLFPLLMGQHKDADSSHHTDITHYHFSFTGTGTVNNSNSVSSYLLNNACTFSIVKKSATLNFSNNWVYGESNGLLTDNDYSSKIDFDIYKTLQHLIMS